MLDEGLAAGLRHLGIRSRTLFYAEREAHPAAVLASRMQEGSLDAAPVWFGDFTRIDTDAFYGILDILCAGIPCQDLSIAGARAGLDGKRSGLFFDLIRIASDCGAKRLFLENVAGIHTATASVVDKEEGALDERAASRILGELADLGWNAEWITIPASDVGASHARDRWFCFAWRVGDARLQLQHIQQRQVWAKYSGTVCEVGTPGCVRRSKGHEQDRPATSGAGQHEENNWSPDRGRHVAHAQCPKRREECVGGPCPIQGDDCGRKEKDGGAGVPGEVLADSQRPRWPQAWCGFNVHTGSEFEPRCRKMADSSQPGSQKRFRATDLGAGQDGSNTRSDAGVCSGASIFAPGPSDPRWAAIIGEQPWLAPALTIAQEAELGIPASLAKRAPASESSFESVLHGVADGLAQELDFSQRAARLRACGNGVVALQAATAFVILARRSELICPAA
ncbi:MAG: DNA cytosine methyltransferase [Patescibacteria group bacterium]|nr:DNA cytosine methyltransferase [Patescibacteria group bacterium]